MKHDYSINIFNLRIGIIEFDIFFKASVKIDFCFHFFIKIYKYIQNKRSNKMIMQELKYISHLKIFTIENKMNFYELMQMHKPYGYF